MRGNLMLPDAPYEKAIEKSADALGKMTDAGTRLGAFVGTVFAPTIQELADWSHDIVISKRQTWRLNNAARVLDNCSQPRSKLRVCVGFPHVNKVQY